MRGILTYDQFAKLMHYIDKNHSFVGLYGRAIKYVDPVFDVRFGGAFRITFRHFSGEGETTFDYRDKSGHPHMYDAIMAWLTAGEPAKNAKS